jgi:tRNA threonylcarbamoyladenosine biosynthesis protein TsaB
MIVLGFDTATPATVVGLRLADGTTLQASDEPTAHRSRETLASDRSRETLASGSHPRFDQHPRFGQRPGHTTRLLPLASELLAQAGLSWKELERIAVGVGPGTFTGLRIGVATARGLAQSLGVEVVGVSTLRVLAEAALRGLEAESRRGVLAAIDARRGEAFVAAYAAEEEPNPRSGRVHELPELQECARELTAPRALAPEDLAVIPAQVDQDREWLAVGDGALRFRECLEAIAVTVPADASCLHRVDAGVLCELAVNVSAEDLEEVLPDYRRRPDAEIALEGGAGGQGLPGRNGDAGPNMDTGWSRDAGPNGDASRRRMSPGSGRNGDASGRQVSPGSDRAPLQSEKAENEK